MSDFTEQTGDTYQSSKFAKVLAVSESKVGKSCYLVASALGVFPGQKYGGVVDKPENLHVLTFDANALGGIKKFLLETCKAPQACLPFKVYNLQDTFRRVAASDQEYDMTFYNAVFQALQRAQERAARGGTHALIISSLTGLAAGCERAIVGPPGKKKGYGSDPSKWKALAHQLHEIQNYVQQDLWHSFWEAHIDKGAQFDMGNKETPAPKESIRVSGEAGRSWAYNVEQVFRIRRNYGKKISGTNCDEVYLDTRPSLDFVASGRGFTESLKPQEPDVTVAFHKLSLAVGRWGSKQKPTTK